MSSVELRKNAQTTMQNGLEKIKGVIFNGVKQQTQNNSNNSNNIDMHEALDQIRSGAQDAKDYCNNSSQAQRANQSIQKAISDYESTKSDVSKQNINNGIKDMQRAVGIQQMQNGIQQVQSGMQNMHSAINTSQSLSASQQIMNGIKQMQQGVQAGSLKQAKSGIQQIQQGASAMQQASGSSSNNSMIQQGSAQMQQGIEDMQGALNNMCNKNLAQENQLNDMGDASVDKMQSANENLQQQSSSGQNQPNSNTMQNGTSHSGTQGSQGSQSGLNEQGDISNGSGSQTGSQGSQSGTQSTQNGSGLQNSLTKSANKKMSQGMSSLSEVLGQGQGSGQGQGQGSGQGSDGDVNRNADGTPKNPFSNAQQKGNGGQGSGGVSVSVDGQGSGQGGNGKGDINKTPSQAGQGKDISGTDSQGENNSSGSGSSGNGMSGQAGNGVSPGFSRDSYSTGKKSGIADTTKTGKSGMDQSFEGAPKYGGNDFASGKKNIDQNLQKQVTVTYNGKKLTGTVQMDVLSNHDKLHQQAGGSATNKRIEESRMALQRIKTKMDMERKKNADLDKDGAGQNSNRFIEFGLESKMSWKTILKKCLQQERRGSSYSYLQPNRRYSNMGMTVVSRVKDKKVDVIKNIKIAVDTSGSVSSEELNLYLSQIARLTKEFDNVTGELLYWSNAVTDVGEFKNIEDLKKIHVGSTGGTDVRCVFEYLNGETKCNGHREEHKPKDIAAIIIITDGCFYNNYEDYAEIFGHPKHKVIWMIEGDAMSFNPPFGDVVQITRQGD